MRPGKGCRFLGNAERVIYVTTVDVASGGPVPRSRPGAVDVAAVGRARGSKRMVNEEDESNDDLVDFALNVKTETSS